MRTTLLFTFFVYAFNTNAQTYSFNKEVISVYKAILKDVEKPYRVLPKTRNSEFKKINFKHPEQHLLNPNAISPINSDLWINLLTSIDTALIEDYGLNDRYFKRLKGKSSFLRNLTFASPVFSDNHQLCVCYITSYSSPESGSGDIFFLEKKDNKWIIVKHIMAYIS